MQLLHSRSQYTVANHTVKRFGSSRWRVKDFGVDGGHLLPDALHLLLVRGVPLGLLDGVAIDHGHIAVATLVEPRVALDPEDHK